MLFFTKPRATYLLKALTGYARKSANLQPWTYIPLRIRMSKNPFLLKTFVG